jgi:hypothetical protein
MIFDFRFPVCAGRARHSVRAVSTIELGKIDPLDPALFQPPPGYQEIQPLPF